MPADPTGVTTDDQSPRPGEGDDPTPAPSAPGRGPAADGGSSPEAPPGAPTSAPAGGNEHTAAHGGAAPPAGGPGAGGTTTAEPPPAPVLSRGPGTGVARSLGRLGQRARARGRGRHTATRAERASRRGLRIDQRLWTIDLWSVFKMSVLFYLCVGLMLLVAGTLLYNAGRSVGTIDQFESFVTRMGAYGECVPQTEVEEGTEFEDDDKCDEGEVLVGGFTLDDGTLFRVAAVGGTILVVAGSLTTVLLVVLVNLLSELTGGVRHTIIREPIAKPAGPPAGPQRRPRPGSPGPPQPSPSGSPGPRREG